MKNEKVTDVCMTGGIRYIHNHTFHFSTFIFPADITPDMLKLYRVTKVRVLFLFLVSAFNFNLLDFSAAILEKGLIDTSTIIIQISAPFLKTVYETIASNKHGELLKIPSGGKQTSWLFAIQVYITPDKKRKGID